MDIQLKRGLLELCVLASVKNEESYGYKMIQDIKPFIEISESTLYPILRRLDSSGCISVRSAEHNGRLRKYYSITDEGREKIDRFCEEWKEMISIYNYIVRGDEKNE